MSDGLAGGLSYHIERFEELESTNSTAREWIRRGAPEGTVIVAERQTAGRGRQGRAWVSLPGALLFSLILRPRLAPEDTSRIGFYCCVAAALAAEEMGLDHAWLKWPNDLVLPRPGGHRAKWGGILVEAGFDSHPWAIAGIGLNIGTFSDPSPIPGPPSSVLRPPSPAPDWSLTLSRSDPPSLAPDRSLTLSRSDPPSPAPRAPSPEPGPPSSVLRPPSSVPVALNGVEPGSLSDAIGRAIAPETMLTAFLRHFAGYYENGAGGDWKGALAAWRKRDWLRGRVVSSTAVHKNKNIQGVAMGVDDRGALILDTPTGAVLVDAGEAHLHTD